MVRHSFEAFFYSRLSMRLDTGQRKCDSMADCEVKMIVWEGSMNKKFNIIAIGNPVVGDPRDRSPRLRISRFKFTLFAILAAVLAFGALAIGLLVGWIIAAVLGSILILGTLGLFLKAAFRSK